MAKERLQKYMAASGVDSRRNCERLIVEGVVKVNGHIVDTLPAFVDPEVDMVTVRGRKLKEALKLYFLLNKPKGVLCTNYDPEGRPRAIDFIATSHRIFCVGRLDAETTGLIILTNDSEMVNRLTHPKYELPKKYQVRLRGSITPDAVEQLRNGVWLPEGKGKMQITGLKVVRKSTKESLVEMTTSKGLSADISLAFLKVGFKVLGLKREQIGRITSKGLDLGKSRPLTKSEVSYLKAATCK
jgi:23S rRNA pseudouridine2605 synthase